MHADFEITVEKESSPVRDVIIELKLVADTSALLSSLGISTPGC